MTILRTTRKFSQRDHDINFRFSLRHLTPKPIQSYKVIQLLQLCKAGVVNVTLSLIFLKLLLNCIVGQIKLILLEKISDTHMRRTASVITLQMTSLFMF